MKYLEELPSSPLYLLLRAPSPPFYKRVLPPCQLPLGKVQRLPAFLHKKPNLIKEV
jgi:hypothetical protein